MNISVRLVSEGKNGSRLFTFFVSVSSAGTYWVAKVRKAVR